MEHVNKHLRGGALALFVAGCASGSFDRLPRQDDAEQIVWRDLYQETHEPPPVEWIDDPDWAIGGCALPGWKVQVMRHDSTVGVNGAWVTRQFSETSYAHELMHYHTYLRTGDIDAAHWRGDWELADEGAKLALNHVGL